jgi:hypothetical protein
MRRLKIAEEERIEPVIKKLALGNGVMRATPSGRAAPCRSE